MNSFFNICSSCYFFGDGYKFILINFNVEQTTIENYCYKFQKELNIKDMMNACANYKQINNEENHVRAERKDLREVQKEKEYELF